MLCFCHFIYFSYFFPASSYTGKEDVDDQQHATSALNHFISDSVGDGPMRANLRQLWKKITRSYFLLRIDPISKTHGITSIDAVGLPDTDDQGLVFWSTLIWIAVTPSV